MSEPGEAASPDPKAGGFREAGAKDSRSSTESPGYAGCYIGFTTALIRLRYGFSTEELPGSSLLTGREAGGQKQSQVVSALLNYRRMRRSPVSLDPESPRRVSI